MFNKIYVSIDNSDISNKVLQEALILAKSTMAKIRIVHVVHLEQITFGVEMVGAAELKKSILEVAQKLLVDVKEELKARDMEAEVELIENYGASVSDIIIEDAKEWGADLFVLGSHHLGSFTHFLAGGVIEDIAQGSNIPILLITKHKYKQKA